MKFLSKSKDGGPMSRVFAYWLMEVKWLCSIVLLNFRDGTRSAYHNHAFNAVSWVLKGRLTEYNMDGSIRNIFTPSLIPVYTSRENMHKVSSKNNSWVLSFRGPWASTWKEFVEATGETLTLSSGRVVESVAHG